MNVKTAPGLKWQREALGASFALAALALGAVAIAIGIAGGGEDHVLIGVSHALLIVMPVLVGLYALAREPAARFARLLVAAGFIWAPTLLASSSSALPYSIGRVGAWFVPLGTVALVLAFPTGRPQTRAERLTIAVAGAMAVLLYLPTALVLAHFPTPSPWSSCVHDCPRNVLSVTHSDSHFADSVLAPARDYAVVALFLVSAVLLLLKAARASRPTRRTLVPVIAGGLLALGGGAVYLVARRVVEPGAPLRTLGLVSVLAVPGLVLGFALGLLRWRLVATSALRRLTRDYAATRSGSRLRQQIAEAIGDPSLEIAYWTGNPGRWVNEEGVPVTLPRDDPGRAVLQITAEDRPIAALVHDAAMAVEPSVTELVGGFAAMALENLRLDAELHSSLRDLRESRARILSAVDYERQRIERDLHDGAQQRLVALRVALELAAETAEQDPQAAVALLAKLGTDVEATLNEVRSLARGVYPPLLADHGIGDALRVAARDSSLPTTVRSRGVGRYSQQIESAVYFCCLEALQNAAKHAGARSAHVTLFEHDELTFVVEDDGAGFVPTRVRGAGLQNMRDRIVSLGGRLTIESTLGEGTRVTGTVPVGLAQLTPDVALLFQRATDALHDCFAIYKAERDSSGQVLDFAVEHLNDAACRDTGRSREAQVGRTLGHLDSHYLESDLFEWHKQALEGDEPLLLDEVSYERSAEGRRLSSAYEVRAVAVGGGRLAVTWRDITERRLREDELQLQSTILARATEAVCLVRASDGSIVYANPRFDETFGYEQGEIYGRHLSELIWEERPGEARRVAAELLADLDEHGEASYERRCRRGDGTTFWCATHARAFEHPDHGRVWLAVKRDVTERRETEDALRLLDRHLSMALHGSRVSLFTMDRELRYTWGINNQIGDADDIHGLGRTNEELFGAEAARPLTRICRRALAGGAARSEIELALPEGTFTFDLTVRPLRDDGGAVIGVAGAAYNLTPRASERQFGQLIDASSLPVAIVGSDFALREVNPAFADLLGYAPDELRGLTLGDVSDPADAGALDTVLSGQELVRRATSRLVTRSGAAITVATIAFRLDSGDDVALVLLEQHAAERRFGASEAARRAFPD